MMAPTGKNGGAEAADSGIDWLARASRDAVTEQHVATHGVTSGDEVGNKMWTPGKLSPTDGDINGLVNTIGLGNRRYRLPCCLRLYCFGGAKGAEYGDVRRQR